MPKNIILLSDGTGNSSANVWRTNVWRVFESLDLTDSSQIAQIAIYDDGIGSSSFKPLAMLGGAFGWGLKRNILHLYSFLCRNYQPSTVEQILRPDLRLWIQSRRFHHSGVDGPGPQSRARCVQYPWNL
jgi:uncharacterized protein (DUF2235 family)